MFAENEFVENESVENNINEYYRLKSKYNNDNEKTKKKILNNKMLSIKEKKAEFKQLKPKCVNCGKPGGTTFASIISKETDGEKFRELRAFCNAVEPCGLTINIAVGNFENISSVLKTIDDEIYTAKNEIINDKNKLLFGLTTTEKVLENFDLQKDNIREYTSLLENYLQIYVKITDDPERKEKLNDELEKSYLHIQSIKEALYRFNETNGIEFVKSAVEIYQNQLRPVLNEVLKLKYRENIVVFDESDNSYHLIQRNYSIKDLEINNDKFETVVFETSVQGDRSRVQGNKTRVDKTRVDKPDSQDSPDIIGKPIINEETGIITWSNKNYQSLWSKMNNELKTALLTDREWTQEFMDNCVRSRLQNKSCEFTNPSNLIIPPQLIEDGMYDFGNPLYNEIFNNFDESYKNTLLSLFSIEDGSKNYTMLEKTLADILKKELKFDKGNF
jgi:hypothetical protein